MYTSRPSDPDAKYYIAGEVWTCAGSKISFRGLKARSSLDFFFSLFLLPSFSAFLASYFFFCWELSKLHYGGNFFWKSFRILGIDETRGSWVVEPDFHGNFPVNVTLFLPFFPVSLTELCSFWYDLKDLFTLPN